MTDEEYGKAIREIVARVKEAKGAMDGEMRLRSTNLELWDVGQCKAWPAYQAAQDRLQELLWT